MDFPLIQRLSPRVIRILGLNPGPFTLQGTNTYLVGTGSHRLLIDTGEGKTEYLALLSQVLEEEKATLYRIFITHWHPDHTGGILPLLSNYPNTSIQIFKKFSPEHDKEFSPFLTDLNFKDNSLSGEPISVEGATLLPLLTPGHTFDHVGLYLIEEGAFFSGDCILGQGSAIFEDLNTYMNTLDNLLNFYPTIKHIYPGHGPKIDDGISKIKEYIKHRQSRDTEIINLLKLPNHPTQIAIKKFFNNKPAYLSSDIVEVLYEGYPQQVLAQAERVIELHLRKLLQENHVVLVDINLDHNWISVWQAYNQSS